MNYLVKVLLYASYLGIALSAESKEVELYFNQTVQENFILNTPIDDQVIANPWQELNFDQVPYCRQLTIQNKGDQVLEDCLPYVNQKGFSNLEELQHYLSKEEKPLLALYHLWNRSVHINNTTKNTDQDPLYLLNYSGVCSQEDYVKGFARLCQTLGIEVRSAGIHGKECYDFYSKNNWQLIDLTTSQVYLGWDNQSLISSEDVMDDPLLALRTKQDRYSSQIDFKQNWNALAHFEIASPYSGKEFNSSYEESSANTRGFNLYPGEKLIYNAPENVAQLSQQSLVEHILNSKKRQVKGQIEYHSIFPIYAIYNGTQQAIYIKDHDLTIPAEETVSLSEEKVFNLTIQARSNISGQISIYSTCPLHAFPKIMRGINHVHLGSIQNPTSIEFIYELDDQLENFSLCELKVNNESNEFDHCVPNFRIEASNSTEIDSIWWQISNHPSFDLVPTNFEQVQSYTSTIELPTITDTFFNADQEYFFRVKGKMNGIWGDWSETFPFIVKKPHPVQSIAFNKLRERQYEISWEAVPNATEYVIFGSNALDFIPSVYCDTQLNALVDGEIVDAEDNHNLITVTKDTKLIVDGSFAYYRLFAKHQSQLSVPSSLVHVYDQKLIQSRNVLQVIELSDEHQIVQRTELPEGYSWSNYQAKVTFALPTEQNVSDFFRSCSCIPTRTSTTANASSISPYIPENVWITVQPYLLPSNHPIKPKLDRMFSAYRVTLNSETFKRAGFKRYKPGKFSRILASSNPQLQGYFIKGFADTELSIREDWKKLIHRIEGANAVRACIEKHQYQSKFKVPQKWLYVLPADPSPPKSSQYLRKNFILVAEDMQILAHKENEKHYYKKLTKSHLDAMYTILNEVGLWDSVFAFNMPFCKDGKIAFIDTEYHHKWPVPFHKLNRYFSSESTKYWNSLIRSGGPQK